MNAVTSDHAAQFGASASMAYPSPIPLHPHGCRVEDIPTHLSDGRPLVTWDGWSPLDCINLDRPDGRDRAPPAGWYSIPHWFALIEPSCFWLFEEHMPDLFAEWARGDFRNARQETALAFMAKEGMEPLEWQAPVKAREAGIATVLLFPDPILRELFA
ncbi:hypothetical protein V5F53_16680 [Xanthobacter sp. V4C-4]|uniref:hypothetical protein n=1 Tax=Xanthobacter cornucopiae TaxID=3119924 RepID=UPI003729A90C